MEPNEPSKSDELAMLRRKRDDADEQIERTSRRIGELNKERDYLQQLRYHLTILIADVQISGLGFKIPGGREPTQKNRQLFRAWSTIYETLEHSPGLSQRKLLNAVWRVMPNLKESTFRSYLHRLKKDGLIQKSVTTQAWRLLEKTDEKETADDVAD